MINVLGLCSYPVESAATRYRLMQFVEPLKDKGINLEISPFLNSRQFELLYADKPLPHKAFSVAASFFKRFAEISKTKKYDLLFVQREAMIFGPAFFEWIFQKFGRLPLVLDLDDATYISYTSPIYGKLGSFFKFFGKTDKLIERADAVICGNRFIAEYAKKKGAKTFVIPTVADTNKLCPIEKNNPVPVLGWIGTHSTFPLIESIFPVLRQLSENHEFKLKIVGAGNKFIKPNGIKVDNLAWSLEREIADFQSLDIGLYPIVTSKSASKEWLLGKSGFKAIQYLSVGIPFVVTPIGVCAEIGIDGETHFSANNEEEWFSALTKLLKSSELRLEMGEKGRKFALENYTLAQQTEKIAAVFHELYDYL